MTDAREYLTSIRKAEERLSLKKRQVENLRDRLTSLSVPTDKEVVSHTPNVGVMADTVAMIADMEAEISIVVDTLMCFALPFICHCGAGFYHEYSKIRQEMI